jgi:PAS domain S-box-containing protein
MRLPALANNWRGSLPTLMIAVVVLAFAAFLILFAARAAAIYETGIREAQTDRGQILSYQLDEETGLRGYTATGAAFFLEPYYKARARFPRALAKFDRDLAVLGLTGLQPWLADEKHLNERWRSTVAGPLRAYWRLSPASIALQRRGKQIIDHFRSDDLVLHTRIEAMAVSADTHSEYVLAFFLSFMVAILLTIATVVRIAHERQKLFNLVVESAPSAMLVINTGGRITLVNAQAERLFGYAHGELVGQPIELLVPEGFRGGHPDLRGSFSAVPSLAREMGAGRDLHGRCKDGSEVPVEIWFNSITSAGESFTLAALIDITERKAVEDLRRFIAETEVTAAKLEAEQEREWSTAFQRAVLPAALPQIPGFSFSAVYEPGLSSAKVGGDWYDVIHLIDGRAVVSIGDVCGNGLTAAVVVGVVRQVMRGIAQLHASPSVILDAADRALRLEYPDVLVSAWVGVIDLVTRTITYASAGHPPPLLISRDGNIRELSDPTAMLIGLREGRLGWPNIVELMQDDTLVLFTDGVIEASHDILAGLESLHAAAVKLALAPDPNTAAATIRQLVIPDGSSDDAAILVVRTDCSEVERHIQRWRFDVSDRIEASAVRGQFIESLQQRNFTTDECANGELVFGELIGNVVRHAKRTRRVDVVVDHRNPHSVLHVMDRGAGFYHIGRLPRDPYAESGRGLFLVGSLAMDFTVSDRPDGGSHARAVLRGGSGVAKAPPKPMRISAMA